MQNRRRWMKQASAAIAALWLGAAALPAPATAAEKLTVFAAASLKDALDAANAAWAKESGKETVASYAASGALAKQIENAAPADVFISADLDWMDYVAKKNLIKADTRSAATAGLRRQFQRFLVLPPLFGFGKRAPGSRGQRLARWLRPLGYRRFAIVIISVLHAFSCRKILKMAGE